MIARIAEIERLPDGLEEAYVERIRSHLAAQDGFCGGYHLVDPESGRGTSITLWRDADALAMAGRSLRGTGDGRITDSAPSTVRIADVIASF